MGTRLERIPRSKLLEELTRPSIELIWQHYLDRDVVIASHATLERRHSLPRKRNRRPFGVPAGKVMVILPSIVGTSILAPRRTSVSVTGTSHRMSLPWRENRHAVAPA